MRILTATDGSDAANRALQCAAKLTNALNGQLEIIHVVALRDIPLEQLDQYTRSGGVSRAEAMTEASRETLHAAQVLVASLGIANATAVSAIELHEGNVAETIIESARRNSADLIVAGKRGIGRLSGLVLGSVSQKLVEHAPLPVIVVP
jgi:nucleotide-binding universal stress UspA family protein